MWPRVSDVVWVVVGLWISVALGHGQSQREHLPKFCMPGPPWPHPGLAPKHRARIPGRCPKWSAELVRSKPVSPGAELCYLLLWA